MAIKVSQAVIDEIKKKGMKAAIEHANSGSASAEFKEGAKRFYGNRVSNGASSKPTTKVESDREGQAGMTQKESRPVPMPKSAPASAQRRIVGKADDPTRKTPAERIVDAGKKTNWGGLTGGETPATRITRNLQKGLKGSSKREKELMTEAQKKGMSYWDRKKYVKQKLGK